MRDIIIIGPKKTATTSLYHAINRCSGNKHDILAKESNIFLRIPAKKIAQDFKQPIIDISPEYYTSFRSIINIKEFVNYRRNVPLIICLSRDKAKRSTSHFAYMFSKGIVSESLLEQEIETICLSELKIWQNHSGLDVAEVDLIQAVKMLQNELGVELNLELENSGDFEPRIIPLYSIMKYINGLVTDIFPTSQFRIFLAKKFGKLIYRRSKKKNITSFPQALDVMLKSIRRDS